MSVARRQIGSLRVRAFALAAATLCAASAISCRHTTGGSAPSSPVKGGEIRFAQQAPRSLDPAEVNSVYEALPVNQIFDGLVDVDAGLSVVPALAKSWVVSREGTEYTFRLRAGVTFHDGSPFSSEDVVSTFRRLLAPEHGQGNVACDYLMVLTGARDFAAGRRPDLPSVRAIDPLTVSMHLDAPYPSFLEVLAMDGLRIVPKHAATMTDRTRFGRAPVGTGPFRLAAWNREKLVLEANERYFGRSPNLDRVEIVFLSPSEADHGASRFYRGEIDVLEAPSSEIDRLSGDASVRLYRHPELSLTFLGLNAASDALRDARVRRAIAHAVNRDVLVSDTGSLHRPATGILPPGIAGYVPGRKGIARDLGIARNLLKEAGHPGGAGLPPLELYVAVGTATAVEVSDRIVADLSSIGFPVVARRVAWEQMRRQIESRSAPAFVLTWLADLTDPDSFLRTLFLSGAPANFFSFADDETDRMLRAGAAETNPVRRLKIYSQAEQHLLELAPVVPLYHTVRVLALRREVRGLEPGPLGLSNAVLERVWIQGRESAS